MLKENTKSNSIKKYIKLFLSLFITAFFLFLSYNNIKDLNISAIKDFKFNYSFILLSILAFVMALFFRGLAWSQGLDPKLSFRKAFQGVVVGMSANMVMPFRMGEAAKTVLLSSHSKIDQDPKVKHNLKAYYHVGINIVLERLMDVFILGSLLLTTLFFVEFSSQLQGKIQWLITFFLIGIVCLSLLIFAFHFLRKRPNLHNPWLKKFYKWVDSVFILSSPFFAFKVLFYLSLSWFSVYLSTLLGLQALGLSFDLALKAALLVLVLVNFAILLPTAPGGIGAFQFACVYGLNFFNIEETTTFVASILLHLVQYAAALPLGLVGFILWRASHEKTERI